MAFGITPSSGGSVPTAPQVFPKQLQIRFNGVDVGGPDATVIDFVGTGFTVTRGTGDDAGVITIEVE